MLRLIRILPMAVLALTLSPMLLPIPAQAESCQRGEFDKAIDDSGTALRQINATGLPEIEAKLNALRKKKHWSEEEFQQQSQALMQDARVEELDRQAYELYAKIDAITNSDPGPTPDCETIAALKVHVLELTATMRAKTAYMQKKLEAALREEAVETAVAESAEPPTVGVLPKPGKKIKPPSTNWSTSTEPNPAYVEIPPAAVAALPPVSITQQPERTYTVEEIKNASRGFFGTISSNLASVTAYSFEQLGSPVGYILGNEGGGAFLAGLRYGKGTLTMKNSAPQPVFWHGPSVGYDIGANGSRVLFLVYNLANPKDIFHPFTGVDGSAYLVGGAGITFLTDGKIVLAPIRSGIGLRLGASAGYIRFTNQETWNPF